MPSREEIVERALGYPFPRPDRCVLIANGRVEDLTRLDARGRTPVLAYGSNASPESLGWKFPEERDAVVPLVRGTIHDLDVVYSSHIAVYGSVPATLQGSPGTAAETFVAYLTDDQLALVEGWEINATYETLQVDLDLELGEPPAAVGAFVSRHGALAIDGGPVAVAEVPARGRRFPALRQPEVLEHVRAAVAPDLGIHEFVTGNVEDYERARAHTARLPAIEFDPSRRGDSNP
ncbi:MAG: hypothetical protein QOH38_1061 [Thermoleophilaceae bacterium]|nr:hypothetical protein [Thermoleophilaceae bacterium]